jgi:hypothetical protein
MGKDVANKPTRSAPTGREDEMRGKEEFRLRSLIVLAAGFVAVCFVFVSINVFTQHAPRAHGLRVAYVGSPITEVFIQQGLNEKAPGAFDLRSYPDAARARRAVLDRAVYGAFIVRGRSALLLSASAAGLGAQQAIVNAFTMMATMAPASVRVNVVSRDLRALPPNDSRGLSSSAYQFALLVSAFVFAILLYILGHGAALTHRLLSIALYVLASAFVGALTVEQLLGALSGHFLAILAIDALFSAAIVLASYGLECLFGLAGTGVAAFALILIGNSTAGGGSNQEFLPGVFRQIGQSLPNGAVVRAIRNTIYFQGNHTRLALVVIGIWALGGLVLVLVASPVRAWAAQARRSLRKALELELPSAQS